jgi:hypothetical protein
LHATLPPGMVNSTQNSELGAIERPGFTKSESVAGIHLILGDFALMKVFDQTSVQPTTRWVRAISQDMQAFWFRMILYYELL